MKVKEIMTPDPRVCSPESNVAAAAQLMLEADCGILPVVKDGKLIGVVTDRDIYVALATRDRRPSELTVGEVVRQNALVTCKPDDDVRSVLEAMRIHRIRRVPVEGFGGTAMGIVSLNDIALAAGLRKAVRPDDVLGVLRAICAHHHPEPHITAA